jgi:hypothetical protein
MPLTERLAILIDANGAQAVNEFNKVGRAAERSLGAVEDRASKAARSLQTIGAGAVGVGGTLTFGLSAAASKASDLEQSVGAVDAVFGRAAATIAQFGQDSANSVGLSTAAFSQFTAQIGALLQGFGFTQDEAAQTSIQLVRLGSDLSAAFGGSVEDAITAIGAALRGERDPIERYGVAFNEAGVQAKIAALGLDTSTAAAEQSAKANATLALIMERTANVQGQFGRESETLAGKQQRAAAAAENAAAALGDGFAPVLVKTSELTTKASEAFSTFDESLGGIPSTIAAIGVVSLDAVGSLSVLAGLLLQYRIARSASASAAAAETTAEVLSTAAKTAGAGATAAATGASVRYTGALEAQTLALGQATGAQLALNSASGTGLAGLAKAAGPIALTAGAIFGAAKAFDALSDATEGFGGVVGTSIDASEEVRALASATNDELVPAFRNLFEEARGGGLDQYDVFRKVAETNIGLAARLRNALADAGVDTGRFDAVLRELGGSASATSSPVGRLASDFKNYPPVLGAATAAIYQTTDGLKFMRQQLASGFELRLGAFDAADSFNAVYEAQTKATSSTRDYRGEQRQLEQATKSVTEAQEQLAEAELALFLARLGPSTRDLADAELDRADAALSLRDAQNAVTDAQRAYNEALKDGDREEINDARRDLERANINVKRSTLANEDALKSYNDTLNSGAEDSARVKEANERLQAAQEQLTDAQYQAEEAQRRITEGTAAAASSVQDYGTKAAAAAEDQLRYVQSLIDAGAPQSEVNEALEVAFGRVSRLESDFGKLNPRLATYLQHLKEIANFEDANEVAFAGNGGIVVRNRDIPAYKPPFDLSQPAGMNGFGTSGFGTDTGAGTTINVQLDNGVILTAVVDQSQLVGGAPITIRPN